MPWVYILTDESGKLYVGCTKNLRTRIEQHLAGRVRYTKGWKNLRVAYAEELPSFREARRREKELKRLPRKKKIELIEGSRLPQRVQILLP